MNTQKQIANYIARQKGWIKANNLKVGDLVLITKSHPSNEKGWPSYWISEMNEFIGKVLNVSFISNTSTVFLGDEDLDYPYTVLRKIVIKSPNDKPGKGDIIYVRPALNFYQIHEVLSDEIVKVKLSDTTTLTTANWRYATKSEIINFYNNK